MIGTEHQTYRYLIEGEIVEQGDEIYDDRTDSWVLTVNSVGDRAPSPLYTSHRKFRRPVHNKFNHNKRLDEPTLNKVNSPQ